jgi:hypothetical protein
MAKLGLFLLVATFLPNRSLGEDCNAGQQTVEFNLFLDEDSATEQGWTLSCDGETIWDVPVGSLEAEPNSLSNSFSQDQVCVPENATCDFTIEDSYGDGLLLPGNYILKWGATTIAVYDHTPFEERSYCFGVNCAVPPQEIAEDCDIVYMYLKTDAKPEETSYSVECNGETIWEGSNHTVANDEIQLETCIAPNSCCKLSVHDSGNDGLSNGGEDENYGAIFLEWAYMQIIRYEGSNGYEFGTVMVDFGLGC